MSHTDTLTSLDLLLRWAANSQSFWKPRFAETLGENGEILRSAKWCQISEIGGAQIGIKFKTRAMAFCAGSSRPASALLAADMQIASRKVGLSRIELFGA